MAGVTESSSTTTSVWVEWTTTTASTSGTYTSTAWSTWTQGATSAQHMYPTQSEVERSEARNREILRMREAELERVRLQEEAYERAKKLLVSVLSKEQREEYESHKHFTVQGKKNRYLIQQGNAFNVIRLDDAGKKVEILCAVPKVSVPMPDIMLAQMLHIQNDEAAFIRVANHRVL